VSDVDPPAAATWGIVLAGGRSSRFGRDKLAEPVGGEPLLWHPIRVLAAICAEVVVVLAPDASEPALPPGLATPVRFARDPERFGGPLVGLQAGLTNIGPVGLAGAAIDPSRANGAGPAVASDAATPVATIALVVGGDQPALVPAVLVELARRARANRRAAALMDASGKRRPLPCALAVTVSLAAAERLLRAGERRPRALLAALDVEDVPFGDWGRLDPESGTLRDVDEPADLAEPAG
jgi:molybdopterin-guanine dinucleotide biosynthesis protein A